MKIIHIPVLCFMFIAITLSQQKHSYGFVGTYNSTNITINKEIENTSSQTGLGIGLFLKVPLSANISAHGEIHYINRRLQYETVFSGKKVNLDCSIHYLHIPLTLQATIHAPFINPFAEVGLYLSQKLSSSPKGFQIPGGSNYPPILSPVTFKPSETGLLLGIGTEIPIPNSNTIIIGYRLSAGLSTISLGLNYSSPWKSRFNLLYFGVII